jgi:hypothetical protein
MVAASSKFSSTARSCSSLGDENRLDSKAVWDSFGLLSSEMRAGPEDEVKRALSRPGVKVVGSNSLGRFGAGMRFVIS